MSNTHYFKGPVMFAKLFEGNRDKGKYAPEGGQYTIDIGLKAKDAKLVKSWNKRYKAKTYKAPYDEGVVDGLQYFQFKRKHVHKIDDLGGPPKVVDAEGNAWNKGLIGNGSVCTVKLNVYSGTYEDEAGKSWPFTAASLEGVRVDEWVPYGKDEDDDGDDEEAVPNDGIPF